MQRGEGGSAGTGPRRKRRDWSTAQAQGLDRGTSAGTGTLSRTRAEKHSPVALVIFHKAFPPNTIGAFKTRKSKNLIQRVTDLRHEGREVFLRSLQLTMAEMMSQVCKSPDIDNEILAEFKVINVYAVGKDVSLSLSITNLTKNAKTINVDIRACSVLYTKKEMHELLKESRKINLKSLEVKEEPVIITYAQYEDLLTPDNAIEVTAACTSEPSNGIVIVQASVVLKNPKFEIKIKGKAYLNKPVAAEIVFTNPLDKDVTDIVVTAEGSGLLKDPATVRGCTVKPNETITIPLSITPYKSGNKQLLIDFTTNKFQNAKGYLDIEVHE
ncbi:protein-glutamine gamma-glutamyltransferase E-like [Mixophyes fleayi]|uniref:protein-glutamine gamma-glutamyltransferase E-like n=1 Tax=Mixophyes fleayi TaxID=3061075 RepID=UPI003F4DB6CE